METSVKSVELIVQQRFDAFIEFLQRQVEHVGADTIAECTGISKAMILSYATGKKNAMPTLRTLVRLSEGLNVSIEDILDKDK